MVTDYGINYERVPRASRRRTGRRKDDRRVDTAVQVARLAPRSEETTSRTDRKMIWDESPRAEEGR